MASKKKKSRKSDRALADQGQHFLATGQFEKSLKNLHKLYAKDPVTYGPELFKAYVGQLQALLRENQIDKAQSLLKKLENLGLSDGLPRLEAEIALKTGQYREAIEIAGRQLCRPERSPYIDSTAMADILVLCFSEQHPPTLPPALRKDLETLHTALQRVSSEKYAEALEKIRLIGINSVFAHWRLFVKGICAFYKGDDTVAEKAFAKLPQGSAPEKASRAFRHLIHPGDENLQQNTCRERFSQQVCVLAGAGPFAAAIARADYLFRVNRIRDAYQYLQANLPDFPSEKERLQRTLSRFFSQLPFDLNHPPTERFKNDLLKAVSEDRFVNPTEAYLTYRAYALYQEKKGESPS